MSGALCVALLSSGLSAQNSDSGPAPGDVFAANFRDGSVSRFDGVTGAFRGVFVEGGSGGLAAATGVAFGPDGSLYVGSSATHAILRFDGETGAFLGAFTEPGVVERPFSLIFESDGHLLVSSGHSVLRLDPDGAIVDTVLTAPAVTTPIGLRKLGTHLLVANAGGNQVLSLRDGVVDVWAPDGLDFPSDVVPTSEGAWVSNAFAGELVLLHRTTGAVVRRAVLPEGGVPVGLAPRADGTIFVADFGADRLFIFDPVDDSFTLASEEGLAGPENLAIHPAPGG